jgi:hypothetical protein
MIKFHQVVLFSAVIELLLLASSGRICETQLSSTAGQIGEETAKNGNLVRPATTHIGPLRRPPKGRKNVRKYNPT